MSSFTNPRFTVPAALLAVVLVIALLAVSTPTYGWLRTTVTKTSTFTSSTTTTETSTSTATETQTSMQTVVPTPAQFSYVTIDLENASSSRTVNTSCATVAGHVYWNVGPIPPTAAWYTVAYANGTDSKQVPLTLFDPYSAYSSDPPSPSSALYNAARFSAAVCGLQNSYVNAPLVEPNLVTIFAQCPTNTFNVTIAFYER